MCRLAPAITLLLICLSTVRCQDGEPCNTEEGSNGTCTDIANCSSQLHDVKNKTILKSCGYNGTAPLVCCKLVPGTKSKQKCENYKNFRKLLSRKVEGERTLIEEYPYMVALGYQNEDRISWHCGGTLISEEYVLTAAHCTFSPNFQVKFARMGTVNLQNPEASGNPEDFKISEIIIHPSYNIRTKYNNIALLKLNSKVTFSAFVHPACLNTDFHINTTEYFVTTWEYLKEDREPSINLKKVDVVPYSYDDCRRIYETFFKNSNLGGIVEESQICAGTNGTEKDTCTRDTGGSLQIFRDKYYYVVGSTSFGKQCGLPNIPTVYTRVSNYISWIEDIVWPSV